MSCAAASGQGYLLAATRLAAHEVFENAAMTNLDTIAVAKPTATKQKPTT